MTNLKFFKKDDKFVGVEATGHTGYSDFGKDVLCATISGIIQACYLGLKNVLNIDVKMNRDIEDGVFSFELPKNLTKLKLDQSQILFETLFVSMCDLCEGYSKYISMEVIE